MSNGLAISVYRRVLKLLALIERVGAGRLARERYVEFLPQHVVVKEDDALHLLACHIFLTTPLNVESLTRGFSFIKDATESLHELELLALWDVHCRDGDCELLRGVALVSAAMRHAGETRAGELAATASGISDQLRRVVEEMKAAIESCLHTTGRRTRASSLHAAVDALRGRGYGVREGTAEDYTALSLLSKKQVSVLVFNALLTVALRELGFLCSLVGMNSHRPWIRIQKGGGSPFFMSFAHTGVHRAKDVVSLDGHLLKPSQLRQAAQWDSSSRKLVLSKMLRMQLLTLSSSSKTPLQLRQLKVCRAQILFLLS